MKSHIQMLSVDAARVLFAVLMVTISFISSAVAGDYEDGLLAKSKGNYKKAAEFFLPLAEAGNGDAQAQLSIILRYGNNELQRDNTKALFWARASAVQGNRIGQRQLGLLHFYGRGVARNVGEAIQWFRKAAEQGDAVAQYWFGEEHLDGGELALNTKLGAEWIRKSAEQGYSSAQEKLGYLYLTGTGVQKDLILGHMWSNIAASTGYHLAAKGIVDMAESKMTPAGIEEAQRLAREFLQRRPTSDERPVSYLFE